MPGLLALAGIVSVGALGAVTASWYLPHLRFGGAAAVSSTAPLPDIDGVLALAPGMKIVCEGDSLTYGSARFGGTRPAINGAGTARVATPFPETLQTLLGSGVSVVNLGFPGDTAAMGLRRWAGWPAGEVAIIMYGTNDANPRGRRAGAVPIAEYQNQIETLARRRIRAGARAIILAPPPTAIPAADAAILPYRLAARRAAIRVDAMFFDPARFLAGIPVPLQIDGIHLNAPADAAIAHGLADILNGRSARA